MAKRLLDDYPNALLAQSDKIHIIDKTQLDKTKNTRPNHKQGMCFTLNRIYALTVRLV